MPYTGKAEFVHQRLCLCIIYSGMCISGNRVMRISLFRFQRNANLYLMSISMRSLAQGAFGVIQGLYILSLGFDETVLGTILSARMLSAAVASLPAGILSDRIGRRPVLVTAGVMTTVGYLGMAVSSSPAMMVLFSCVNGIAMACQATSGAPLLAESSTPADRARLFGVNFSLSMAATMIGSLVGGVLPGKLLFLGESSSFRWSLLVFAAITLGGVWPARRIEEDPPSRPEPAEPSAKPISVLTHELRSLTETAREKDILCLLTYGVLIGFGAGLVVPFFNVFLSQKLGIQTATIGLIMSVCNGATAIAGLVAPVLAEKYGPVATVVGTQIASIPFLMLIALPPNVYLVSVALFMRSALMNMSSPVASTVSMELAGPDRRGRISSLMRIADNVARALSAVAAGYIMSKWGYEVPYFFTAVLYFAASIVYWKAFRDRDKHRRGSMWTPQ